MEGLLHFACIGWKVLFALVPPAKMGGGIPAFCIALAFIGMVTAVVGEVATVLGCVIGLKPSVAAITLVAIGTSLPDTFASMVAAQTSKYADSAVGNVTGSNSVNVFLGLGLPWVIAATWSKNNDMIYLVPAGDLAFSVALFLMTSTCCFIILIVRRCVSINYNSLLLLDHWRRTWWTKILKVPISRHSSLPMAYLHYFLVHQRIRRFRLMKKMNET